MLDQVNALRAILVGGAVIAAILTALAGFWSATVLLVIGIVSHGLLWRYLRRATPHPESK